MAGDRTTEAGPSVVTRMVPLSYAELEAQAVVRLENMFRARGKVDEALIDRFAWWEKALAAQRALDGVR